MKLTKTSPSIPTSDNDTRQPSPYYKICTVTVIDIEDYKKLEDEVNKYITLGYELAGSLAITHSADHTDAAQPLIKYPITNEDIMRGNG
jgi:hypothetical protein